MKMNWIHQNAWNTLVKCPRKIHTLFIIEAIKQWYLLYKLAHWVNGKISWEKSWNASIFVHVSDIKLFTSLFKKASLIFVNNNVKLLWFEPL